MILYVNGDSHTAAAEAVNSYGFACDDSQFFYLGQAPHPDNFAVSWGKKLANSFRAGVKCDAQAGCSNTRIIRTTKEFLTQSLDQRDDCLIIIQWSTWEREEWLHNGVYYQVGASGVDGVPQELQEKYRHFIVGLDWAEKTRQAHDQIWAFHEELQQQNIKHIFFNGNNSFENITDRKPWGVNYIGPYDPKSTYDSVLKQANFETVAPNSWHFGKEAHSFWAKFMLQYCIDNNFI